MIATLILPGLLLAVLPLVGVFAIRRGGASPGRVAALVCVILFTGSAALDEALYFEALPFRWPIACSPLLMLLPRRARTPGSLVTCGLAILSMAVVLPRIPWNGAKAFYIDAHRIRTGMPAARAVAIMEGRPSVPADAASAVARGLELESIVFLRSQEWPADSCRLVLEDGLVRAVRITKD